MFASLVFKVSLTDDRMCDGPNQQFLGVVSEKVEVNVSELKPPTTARRTCLSFVCHVSSL